ncbi:MULTISPECIES: transglutaminase domain-containing protein [unclassified Clostridium]|uniref:transglutaminase domain-containing protein n=1 Tax=unclassified Clostridium TaxID=2614128 RepID=UPI000297EE26|nr:MULTISPECIES: transglutaminase domain-containing protein [unclassified Clostridium]EKQ55191.1 MAG: transglutaminase-like enzyme, putative cysteine protease [Clostridium sp. Maddingley MBC34-26]
MEIRIKTEIISELYMFIREFSITMLILYGIFKSLGWEIPFFYLFLISLLIVVITGILSDFQIKKMFFGILAIFIVIILLVMVILFKIKILLFLQNAFHWNYEYFKGVGEFNLPYSMVTVFILSLIIIKIVRYMEKYIILKVIMALVLLVFMIICGMNNIQWNAILTGMMLFCCFDIIVEAYLVKAGGMTRYTEACLAPFIAAAVFLAICFPSDKQPIKWSWANYTINSIKDNVQDLIYNIEQFGNEEKNEFDVKRAGFSEEGTNSFGKLIDEKERNMFFLSTKSNIRIRYLNGLILDTYTGSQWKKDQNSYDSYVEEYKMDLYEKLYNLYHTDLMKTPDEYFAKKISYKIRFDKLETKTVFRPENSFSIESDENRESNQIGDNVYFADKGKKGDSYDVSAVIMNMDNKNLKQYIRGLIKNDDYYKQMQVGKGNFEGSLFKESINAFNLSEDQVKYITSNDFREYLFERSKRIKEEYLQIPKETPERVRELAEDITKDCTNQYDKAEAICEYLKDNYDYSTKIDQLPEGKDAVDYFLFEQKQGYCIYFASAMAIMCRYLDIPTRYVEGVTLDYSENDEEWYKVKTKSAHVWTEIYIEGFGWIRMDPTPGSYDNAINWSVNNGGWQEHINSDNKSTEKIKVSAKEDELQTLEDNSFDRILLWIKHLFIGLALSVIIVLLGIGTFKWNKKRIYKKSSNREKVFICMRKIILNLEKQGYGIKEGETLKEFKERLEKDETFDNLDIIKLLDCFQNIRYSSKNVTDEEVYLAERLLVLNKAQSKK